jgi:hypothetical protein
LSVGNTNPKQRGNKRKPHLAKLKNLPNVIPNIISFNLGFDILHLERSFDLGLVAVYPDRAALDFYTETTLIRKRRGWVKKLPNKLYSVDFTSE